MADTLTVEEREQVAAELAGLRERYEELCCVEPVSLEALRRLEQTRHLAVMEMLRLQELLYG